MRILIAGVGNVLKADDAYGVVVAQRLMEMELPAGVDVVETGIGGIALVHELQNGYDAMIVADAVDRQRPPGTVMIIEPDVIDVNALSWGEKSDLLSDIHLATPERVFMMAKALGVLPSRLVMVGCQPVDVEALGTDLSPEVTAAVEVAIVEILRVVEEFIASESAA